MTTASSTETGTNGSKKGTKSRGRKTADKQPAVERPQVLGEKMSELLKLHSEVVLATEEFGEAIKKVAEESGLLAKNVRSFVLARAGERFAERKREVGQLDLLFNEIGE